MWETFLYLLVYLLYLLFEYFERNCISWIPLNIVCQTVTSCVNPSSLHMFNDLAAPKNATINIKYWQMKEIEQMVNKDKAKYESTYQWRPPFLPDWKILYNKLCRDDMGLVSKP